MVKYVPDPQKADGYDALPGTRRPNINRPFPSAAYIPDWMKADGAGIAPVFGCLKFISAGAWMSLSKNSVWTFDDADFCLEWYQFQIDSGEGISSYPRIFELGSYPAIKFGVTNENNTVYVWMNNTFVLNTSITGHLNKWTHFALARQGQTLRLFQDGALLVDAENSDLIQAADFVPFIGAEEAAPEITIFPGYLADLRMVVGYPIYTAPFSPPSAPLTAVSGTILLISTTTAASAAINSSPITTEVTNNGAVWQPYSPYVPSNPPPGAGDLT